MTVAIRQCQSCGTPISHLRAGACYCGDSCSKRARRNTGSNIAARTPLEDSSKAADASVRDKCTDIASGESVRDNRTVQIAGPPLSPSQWRCATLPLDSHTAEAVRQFNREPTCLPNRHSRRNICSLLSRSDDNGIRNFNIRESKVAGDPGPIPDVLRRSA